MLVTDAHVAAMKMFAEGQHSSKLPAIISALRFIARAHETRFDPATIICSNPTCCAPQGEAPYKNCGSCMAMSYCTVACQRAHWRLHKAQSSGAANTAAGRVAVRAERSREAATELLTQVIAQNLPMMRCKLLAQYGLATAHVVLVHYKETPVRVYLVTVPEAWLQVAGIKATRQLDLQEVDHSPNSENAQACMVLVKLQAYGRAWRPYSGTLVAPAWVPGVVVTNVGLKWVPHALLELPLAEEIERVRTATRVQRFEYLQAVAGGQVFER